jgi:hypothetical protein
VIAFGTNQASVSRVESPAIPFGERPLYEAINPKASDPFALRQLTVVNRHFGSMLLKKSLSTTDQNFSRPLMRFSDKNVRDLVS